MVSTTDLQRVSRHADNIYEAIIMIARRARQINDEQKIIMERELGLEDTAADFDDDEFEQIIEDRPETHLPKPSTLALYEFLDGDLYREYVEEKIDE